MEEAKERIAARVTRMKVAKRIVKDMKVVSEEVANSVKRSVVCWRKASFGAAYRFSGRLVGCRRLIYRRDQVTFLYLDADYSGYMWVQYFSYLSTTSRISPVGVAARLLYSIQRYLVFTVRAKRREDHS